MTVFRFTRRITSDDTCTFFWKRCGALCVCFDSHVLVFISVKVYKFGVKIIGLVKSDLYISQCYCVCF